MPDILKDFESIKAELTSLHTNNNNAMTALKAAEKEVLSLERKKEKSLEDINILLGPSKKQLTKKSLIQVQSKLTDLLRLKDEAMNSFVRKRVESRVKTSADGSKTFDTRHMTASVKKYLESNFDLPLCADIFSLVVEQYVPRTDKINKRSAAIALNSNQFASLFSMSHQGPNSESDHFLSWVENKDLKRSDVMNWVVEHVFSNKPSEYKVGSHDVKRTGSKPEYKIASLLYAFVEAMRKNKDASDGYLESLHNLISNPKLVSGISDSFGDALTAAAPKSVVIMRAYRLLRESLHSDADAHVQKINSSLASREPRHVDVELMRVLDSAPTISEETIKKHTTLKGLIGKLAQTNNKAEEDAGVEPDDIEDDAISLGALLKVGSLVGCGSKAPVSCMEPCDGTIDQIQKKYLDNSDEAVRLRSLHASISDYQAWLDSNAQQEKSKEDECRLKLACTVGISLDVFSSDTAGLGNDVIVYAKELQAGSKKHTKSQSYLSVANKDKGRCEVYFKACEEQYSGKVDDLKAEAEKIKNKHLDTLVERLKSKNFTIAMREVAACISDYRRASDSWFFRPVRWYYNITGSNNWQYSHNQSADMAKLTQGIEHVKQVNSTVDVEEKKRLIDEGEALFPFILGVSGAVLNKSKSTGARTMSCFLRATVMSGEKVHNDNGVVAKVRTSARSFKKHFFSEPEDQTWIKQMLNSGLGANATDCSRTA